MTKVYLLEIGEYSDRHVAGVFSTREAAEAAMQSVERGRHEVASVEEETVDEAVGWEYGRIYRARVYLANGSAWEPSYALSGLRHPRECVVNEGTDVTGPYVEALSPIGTEHAAKVAVERRQAWLRAAVPAGA